VKSVSRPLHRLIAPWLALPLLITLATGITYRVGRAWFGMDKANGGRILDIHIGEWLSNGFAVAYIALTGLGLLALALSGAWML